VTATEEDFRYAARLFAELHTTGGSLEAKFDRNEQLVLSLAARNRVEQFTIRDLQRWTGWPYHKARRLLLGYEAKGRHYLGLLDRSPALPLLDRTTTEDDEDGRGAKLRQFVFLFDAGRYRESRASGLAWLADETPGMFQKPGPGTPLEHPLENRIGGHIEVETEDERDSGENEKHVFQNSEITESVASATTADGEPSVSEVLENRNNNLQEIESIDGSDEYLESVMFSKGCSKPCSKAVPKRDFGNSPDPYAFIALDNPTFEPCSACGRKPSSYREKWREGMTARRVLCRRCYDSAVRRAQAAVELLPRVIAPGAMERVTTSVGRCDVCGLEKAAWKGQGVHLCETCYQRESRRAVEAGEVVAEG
jgi:hypothetical protein